MDEKEDNKNCQRSWESKGIEGFTQPQEHTYSGLGHAPGSTKMDENKSDARLIQFSPACQLTSVQTLFTILDDRF